MFKKKKRSEEAKDGLLMKKEFGERLLQILSSYDERVLNPYGKLLEVSMDIPMRERETENEFVKIRYGREENDIICPRGYHGVQVSYSADLLSITVKLAAEGFGLCESWEQSSRKLMVGFKFEETGIIVGIANKDLNEVEYISANKKRKNSRSIKRMNVYKNREWRMRFSESLKPLCFFEKEPYTPYKKENFFLLMKGKACV